VWWSGASQTLTDGQGSTFEAVSLVCEAVPSQTQVWGTEFVDLYGSVIVPNASYEISLCDEFGNNCSAPLLLETGIWGDVVPPFGTRTDFLDIAAIVSAFMEDASAPPLWRADLVGNGDVSVPNVPDRAINFHDISAAVSAFVGDEYPYPIPACP